jgi:predicted dehydrogenase
MRKLRAAIVGAGLIAVKKHIQAFLKLKSKVELIAICDVNVQAAQKVVDSLGLSTAVCGDLSEMLSSNNLDLLDIATPPQTHAKLAVLAMQHGCHLFIEKPMALTMLDCDEIVNMSQKYGIKVCVGHSDLFYWPFIKARRLVARGDIGDFRGMRILLSTPTDYMTAHEDHWAHRLPGGVIGETGPHAVYMSLAFINPIREVNVTAKKLLDYSWSRFEDYRIDLIGDNGISSITLSYATDEWIARLDIMGSKATLMLDLEGMYLVQYRRHSLKPVTIGLSLLRESAQIAWDLLSNVGQFATRRLHGTHDILIEQFVDSIRNETEPPVTVEEGREAVRVINMIVERLEEKYG